MPYPDLNPELASDWGCGVARALPLGTYRCSVVQGNDTGEKGKRYGRIPIFLGGGEVVLDDRMPDPASNKVVPTHLLPSGTTCASRVKFQHLLRHQGASDQKYYLCASAGTFGGLRLKSRILEYMFVLRMCGSTSHLCSRRPE